MRYKERIIEHNLHKPREYHTDTLKLQEVDFDSSVISHHPKSFEYYFTHGLVVNDRRYIVKEFFVKHGKLYAILTEDEDTYYEMYLSFLDENVIEDLKKDISDLKTKDKQFDKRLSDLENVRKQNQTLSINDRTISISGGNSIELPVDKDTIYDDTALKQRVKTLEDKPDKADQTLSINDRTISISGGNSIELPDDKDTKYTVKGSGLVMDPDNSIRLDAKPIYYHTNHIGETNGVTVDSTNYMKLHKSMRLDTDGIFGGVIHGNKYNLKTTPDRRFGLINEVTHYYDISYKYVYDDEFGKSSKSGFVKNTFSHITQNSSDAINVRVPISDYIFIDFNIEFDLNSPNNTLTFGYTNDLVFTPESDDYIRTYTNTIEYNEIDSKEPTIISVMDGSKEKYHIEVVVNSIEVRAVSHDAFMSFKDNNSGNYVLYGGING